ncbi:MAG: sporulation protein YunB [Oscillospiraceae bacterium]|nr:sporulation protein YunB [Oscillospiraceae bacterium]
MPKSIIISNGGVSSIENANAKTKRGGFAYGGGRDKKRFKAKYRALIFLFVLLLLTAVLWKYSESRVRPIMASMAEAHARSIGSKVVSEAISEEIEDKNISYDDLISFEKDENGKIAALKTDIIMVNRLKSNLSVVILDKLAVLYDINLYIPVGNLVNGEFFSGRGPRIELIVLPVGSVTTNITNVFTSAGINQTRHQIMLEVYVTVSVIMPFTVESTDIMMSVAIAETIIVGDVPNMYLTH